MITNHPVYSKYSNSPSHWSYASTGAASACLSLHSHPYSASLWTAKAEGKPMDWKHLLAYITGTVDQALLPRKG
jgi:hypothetical protein